MTWKFMREKAQRKAPNADMDAHGGGQGEAPGDVSLAVELNTMSLLRRPAPSDPLWPSLRV